MRKGRSNKVVDFPSVKYTKLNGFLRWFWFFETGYGCCETKQTMTTELLKQ